MNPITSHVHFDWLQTLFVDASLAVAMEMVGSLGNAYVQVERAAFSADHLSTRQWSGFAFAYPILRGCN